MCPLFVPKPGHPVYGHNLSIEPQIHFTWKWPLRSSGPMACHVLWELTMNRELWLVVMWVLSHLGTLHPHHSLTVKQKFEAVEIKWHYSRQSWFNEKYIVFPWLQWKYIGFCQIKLEVIYSQNLWGTGMREEWIWETSSLFQGLN